MFKSSPFARANAMMAAIAAAMSMPFMAQKAALAEIGTYESRGKGEGRSNRRPAGAHKAANRAAAKARRVRAHRARA